MIIKWIFDRIVSLVGLLILWPVLLIVEILVKVKFRMTDSLFKKRRNGWAFAKRQFSDRLMINRGLGYGFMADAYGFAMFCLLVSPAWVKKIAYRVLR